MPLYQVMQHPKGSKDPFSDSGAVFIQDRFSWTAALFTPLWTLYNGLIAETVIWTVGVVLLGIVAFALKNPGILFIYPFAAALIGWEASNILAAGLRRRGYFAGGDIVANSSDMAEMEWLKRGAGA